MKYLLSSVGWLLSWFKLYNTRISSWSYSIFCIFQKGCQWEMHQKIDLGLTKLTVGYTGQTWSYPVKLTISQVGRNGNLCWTTFARYSLRITAAEWFCYERINRLFDQPERSGTLKMKLLYIFKVGIGTRRSISMPIKDGKKGPKLHWNCVNAMKQQADPKQLKADTEMWGQFLTGPMRHSVQTSGYKIANHANWRSITF